jgi:Bacterial toxin homologue of phage lysozyme, C-term
MAIDWTFIGTLEGQSILKGYVPNASGSDSGVTIATGCDLGQLTPAKLDGFDIPAALKTRLRPYLGLRRQAAQDFLDDHPLEITAAEADALDAAVRAPIVDQLRSFYDGAVAPGAARFDDLPDAAQTVIASVAFQYGSGLKTRTPHFWATVVAQDWPKAIAELRNFGDHYPTRRNKEADYLANALG